MEKYTKKLVKGIYRTFQENKYHYDESVGNTRSTFTGIDKTSTNHGGVCLVRWTNSFIEVFSILERNAREHNASLVLFTGDNPKPKQKEVTTARNEIEQEYSKYNLTLNITDQMAAARVSYKAIQNSHDQFRVTTNEGVDADDGEDGMIRRVLAEGVVDPYSVDFPYVAEDVEARSQNPRVFQGFKYGDLPTTYVIGDGVAYS